QTFLNFFLCETRLLLPSAIPENRRAPSSSTHICRLLVFKEHSLKAAAFSRLRRLERPNYADRHSPRQALPQINFSGPE
ncbi:hypothetical protein AB4Y32_26155, partial [Paraburkholderia phymatum]